MTNSNAILLTGGTGFLGSNLLKKLVAEGCRVILLVRSSSDVSRIKENMAEVLPFVIENTVLSELFENHQIDLILHCATNYGRKKENPTSLLEANLILPLKLLQLGKQYGASCFINTDTILDKGINYYSLSKSQFRDWLKIYSDSMTCINVALEHFYGPYDDDSKFATFIIHGILKNINKLDLTLGEQKRDFIYIDDVIEAFMKIIRQAPFFEKGLYHYEIGTGHSIRIKDFVALAKKIAGNSFTLLNYGALPYRENEVMETSVDTSEIKKLGWRPARTLEEGLKETIRLEKELLEL